MIRRLTVQATLATVAAVAAAAHAEDLPLRVTGNDSVLGAITPTGDRDSFALELLAGDRLTAKVKDGRPDQGLSSTLKVTGPTGADVTPFVRNQGAARPSFTLDAASSGVHVMSVTGDPGGFGGATGNYVASFKVKRAKFAPVLTQDDTAGTFRVTFAATGDAQFSLNAKVDKGSMAVTRLLRPDGSPEPAIPDSVAVKSGGKGAKIKALRLTGGIGTYVLEGTFDPGVNLRVKPKLKHGDVKRKRELDETEPVFEPTLTFPDEGITATVMTVTGRGFSFDPGEVDAQGRNVTTADDLFPEFRIGGVEVPSETVTRPVGDTFRFPIPAGLAPGASYDIEVVNFDGQGAVIREAIFIVPLPTVGAVSPGDAGPAGGRNVRISGSGFRDGSLVVVDQTVVRPLPVHDDRVDFVAPPHAPGTVDVVLRDDFGREVVVPGALTYLDRGSNALAGLGVAFVQAIGGEVVTATGVDFAADSTFTLDGTELDVERDSATQVRVTTQAHEPGTFEFRVEDSVEQSSTLDVEVRGFTDGTDGAIPTPNTGQGVADGWRTTSILRGDVNGDQKTDLLLLRPEQAFGGDAQRSRIRVLLGDGSGGFTDATSTAFGTPSGDEDGRAESGALVDVDGNQTLDLVIVTRSEIEMGTRSSLRLFVNNGSGVFTDATDQIPVPTAYGDRNQGRTLAVADVDGLDGPDLIVIHEESFSETVITTPPPQIPPQEPPPDDIVEIFDYPGTRIFLNDGSGTFTRSVSRSGSTVTDRLPPADPNAAHQFQGDTIVAKDVDDDDDVDLLLSRDDPIEDPANPGTFLLTCVLLRNDGTGTFTDQSASGLPAASDPEYLQADRLFLEDVDGNGTPDLIAMSDIRLVSPVSGTPVDGPATRIFLNDGAGVFSAPPSPLLPAVDRNDRFQANDVAVGDLNGDSKVELVLISPSAPNTGGPACRVLVRVGDAFAPGTIALPSSPFAEDNRGFAVLLHDLEGDGDLDLFYGRSEADDTVRNLRVLVNPQR